MLNQDASSPYKGLVLCGSSDIQPNSHFRKRMNGAGTIRVSVYSQLLHQEKPLLMISILHLLYIHVTAQIIRSVYAQKFTSLGDQVRHFIDGVSFLIVLQGAGDFHYEEK